MHQALILADTIQAHEGQDNADKHTPVPSGAEGSSLKPAAELTNSEDRRDTAQPQAPNTAASTHERKPTRRPRNMDGALPDAGDLASESDSRSGFHSAISL